MSTIRGLTIAIGADTKQFNKDIKKVDREIRSTNSTVRELTKSLELDFNDDRFSEAMRLAQKVIEDTEFKAKKLRDEIKYLEDAGTIDTTAYKSLQTQLIRTESDAVLLKQKLEEINKLKLDRISEQVKQVGDGFSKAGQALKPFSVAAAGVLASFTAIAASSVSTASKIDDLAQSMGMTAEEYQRFDYIAMQTGSSTDRLARAFVVLRTGVGKALIGETSKSMDALQQLGFTIEDLQTMSQEDIFNTTISRLSSMENETMKVALATQIFNERIVADIMPTLNAGSDAMASLSSEFETLGYLTNEQVKSMSDFDDVLNRLKMIFANLKNEIGAAMLPLMETLAEIVETKIIPAVRKLTDWLTNLSDSQQKFLFGGLALVASLSPILLLIGKLTSGIGGLISSTGGLSKALGLLSAHPIIAIIGLIAVLIGIMYTKNEQFRESINNLVKTLGNALMPILEVFGNILNTLMEAIGPIIDMVAVTLAPIIDYLAFSISILGEQLRFALIPLQVIAKIFEVIIAFVSPLIEGITAIANAFQNVLGGAFDGILEKVRGVTDGIMGYFETAINWVIDKVNWLIKQVNKISGIVGITIDTVDRVDLTSRPEAKVESSPTPEQAITPEQVITNTSQNYSYPQSVTNNDYSQKEIKIEVIVQNYAEEVDVDKMVDDINLKLAEQF